MFPYTYYTNCLQEESSDFRLEVLAQLFATENHTREIGKIPKNFGIIPTFHAGFSVPKCHDIPIIYTTYKKIWCALVWKY